MKALWVFLVILGLAVLGTAMFFGLISFTYNQPGLGWFLVLCGLGSLGLITYSIKRLVS